MIEQKLDLAADPLELARRLAGRDCVSLFWAREGKVAYLTCDPIQRSDALDPEPDLTLAPRSLEHAFPRWVGLLPYECRRELERGSHGTKRAPPQLCEPLWFRYAAVAEIAFGAVRVVGEDRERVQELAARLRAPAKHPAQLELQPLEFEAADMHRARIRHALEHIRAGELYQVNLARRFDFRVQGAALDVLARLLTRGPARYAAAFSWGDLDVVSISPELFLNSKTSGAIFTSPIKGTRPRGQTAELDLELARALELDPKERAELAMVLDVERNDLARLAKPGSVQLTVPPHVETHATVHHRVATLRATLRPGLTRTELLRCMLPSGSVTGAPKVRAMDLIAELEAERRGLYTGAFGYLSHDGSLELAMAIRTLSVRGGQGHYFAGGGIVADSDPERELEETLWKTQALLGLSR